MPITGPASYLPSVDSFIAHWSAANLSLGASGPIVMAGGMTVTSLQTLRDSLAEQRATVEVERTKLEGSRADIEIIKSALLERLNQFNGKLPSLSPDTRWVSMRPKAFSRTDGSGKILPVLDELESLWSAYDAENPPITLMGGYSLADFESQLAALKTAYTSYTRAEVALGLARGSRNETQDKIRPVLVQYRQRIPTEFPAGSAIVTTLPSYSAPETSRTPDAVTLSGSYDLAESRAELAWTPVTDDEVSELQLRATSGPEYEASDEVIVATIMPDAAATWTGTYGLQAAGSATTFKLYSITPEGHEKASNAITITRPVAGV